MPCSSKFKRVSRRNRFEEHSCSSWGSTYRYARFVIPLHDETKWETYTIIASKVYVCYPSLPAWSNSHACNIPSNVFNIWTWTECVSVLIGLGERDEPERTGWMLFKRMVMASRLERESTASTTSVLLEKISAILPWNRTMTRHIAIPITVDCATETIVANLAAFPLPAPSSFATLTLFHLD